MTISAEGRGGLLQQRFQGSKVGFSKALGQCSKFNKYVIQSAYSRIELTFYLDAIQCTTAMLFSVTQKLVNLAIVRGQRNG